MENTLEDLNGSPRETSRLLDALTDTASRSFAHGAG
jgi:hypothetical protein